MRDKLIELAAILIQIAIYAATIYFIQYKKKAMAAMEMKMGKDKFEMMITWAEKIVRSTEQLYPEWTGPQRFETVLKIIKKYSGPSFTDDELTHLIEAAVQGMNEAKKKKQQPEPVITISGPGIIDAGQLQAGTINIDKFAEELKYYSDKAAQAETIGEPEPEKIE